MMKSEAKFIALNGGGAYRLEIYLTKNSTEKQNAWARANGETVFGNEKNGYEKDLVYDGFKVSTKEAWDR